MWKDRKFLTIIADIIIFDILVALLILLHFYPIYPYLVNIALRAVSFIGIIVAQICALIDIIHLIVYISDSIARDYLEEEEDD